MIYSQTGSKYQFPKRDGNQFRLLIDGGQFYPAMLDTIRSARAYVLMEIYLFESGAVADRFIDALITVAARGIAVYLLLDDFGAKGLLKQDRLRLEQGNIRLSYYNPVHYRRLHHNFFRDHRKLLLVDGEVAFTGGAGITDDFDPPHNPALRWRETVIEIRGAIVADWQTLFAENWRHCTDLILALPHAMAQHAMANQRGQLTIANGATHAEIKRSLLNKAHNARHTLWITTAYFVPSWKIRRALRAAALRGVDVRLLLPGEHTDHPAIRHAGRRFYYNLLSHGVRIFEYQPRFTHAKVLLCDDWVSIGSSNIDRWNFHWNLEANQEVEDTQFAAVVRAMFDTDFTSSREYHLDEWRTRPWYRRLLERFWGGVDITLERLGKRHHL